MGLRGLGVSVVVVALAGVGCVRSEGGPDCADPGAGSARVPAPEITTCVDRSGCRLEPARIWCGCSQGSRGDIVAILASAPWDDSSTCCGTICLSRPRDTSLQPDCQDGHCVVLDLHETGLATCVSDDDCTLEPVRCCGCFPRMVSVESDAIGVRSDSVGALRERLCGLDRGATCDCSVTLYAGVHAVCDAGFCAFGYSP